MFYKPLKQNSIFNRLFEDKFIEEVALTMDNNVYMPKDIIINEDDKDNKDMFFIYRGSCIVFHKKSNTSLKLLAKNEFFGEYSFFTNQSRISSVRAHDFSEIYKIDKKKFMAVLSTTGSSNRERFYQMKDEILYYNNIQF